MEHDLGSRGIRRAMAALAAGALVSCSMSAETPSQRTRVLTVQLADDWAAAPSVVDAIADFEAQHDVQVVVRPAKFGQLEAFMIADRSGLRDLDVAQWHAFAAGALGYALPVTRRFEAEYPDGTFVPGAVEDVAWGPEIYGVPLDVNAMVLIVNRDLLAVSGHGVDALDTWEGVESVARAAADDGVRLTHVPVSTWNTFGWLRANGATWFESSPDGAPRLMFASAPVRETFRFLAGLARDDKFAFAAEAVDSDAEALPLFLDQQILALATGTWDVATLLESPPDFEWSVRAMPTGPSADGPGTVLGGSSLYVTEQADDPDLAWAFVTHMIEPAYALRYARDDGRLPGRVDVLADPFFADPRFRVAVEQLPHASPMRLIAFPRTLDLATRSIVAVLQGDADVDIEFRDLQRRAERLVASSNQGSG